VLIIIGYVVSPFEDIDRAAMGLAPQSWLDRVLNVSPYVMVCLWIIRTFDTYKSVFVEIIPDGVTTSQTHCDLVHNCSWRGALGVDLRVAMRQACNVR